MIYSLKKYCKIIAIYCFFEQVLYNIHRRAEDKVSQLREFPRDRVRAGAAQAPLETQENHRIRKVGHAPQ